VDGLATYSEVLLQREVVRIEHDARSVRVHTRGGGEGLDADAVLVTVRSHVTTRRRRTQPESCVLQVPLGVLKAKTIKFAPALPAWKRGAIERVGFGPIEKVVLLFHRRFWEADADFFGCMLPDSCGTEEYAESRGEFFMFWNLERSHGLPALTCISSGMFAETTWRTLSYKAVVSSALAVLERTFGDVVHETFRRSIVTDWCCRASNRPRPRACAPPPRDALRAAGGATPSRVAHTRTCLSRARAPTTTTSRAPSARASSLRESTPTGSTPRRRRGPCSVGSERLTALTRQSKPGSHAPER
jgi:hypothetical protein